MHTKSIKTAAALLRANGVSLRRDSSGEFVVRLANAKLGEGYFTDDLDDAVATGLDMAQRRDAAEAAAVAARNAQQSEDVRDLMAFVFSNR